VRYRAYFAERNTLYLICWVKLGRVDRPVIAKTLPELLGKAKKIRRKVR
jgi:hypothetical protein